MDTQELKGSSLQLRVGMLAYRTSTIQAMAKLGFVYKNIGVKRAQ
jgi:hypothetical protein